MTDTPKFTVIDRRKMKAEEEQEQTKAAPPAEPKVAEPAAAEPKAAGPRLVVNEPKTAAAPPGAEAQPAEMPPPPTVAESQEQKTAYDASAQRLEDIVRAQNPAMGPQPPVTFDHLVQQLYLTAMIQMGAGAQEGQQPRVDILGARQTIDLMGIVAEKTKGNLTEAEDRTLQTVLFDVRMAFLELTSMVGMQGVPPVPPPGGKR